MIIRNFETEKDSRGRIIYAAGDIVGIYGKGLFQRLSAIAVIPETRYFHFLLIGDYIVEEDDYVTLESIGKGVAVGRLSWYSDRKYLVYRVNRSDFAALGKRAAQLASKFGRHKYDYLLIGRMTIFALGYILKEIFTGHIPRPVSPEQIPYKSDRAFICTELVFETWEIVGVYLRALGHAPMPAEFTLAVDRGDLVIIDFNNPMAPRWPRPSGVAAIVGEDLKADDTVTMDGNVATKLKPHPIGAIQPKPEFIGREGGHNKKRNKIHIYQQPFGYPIRVCDWTGPDEKVERFSGNYGDVTCKHCRAIIAGEREILYGSIQN